MQRRYSSKVKRSNGNAQFAVQFCVAAPFNDKPIIHKWVFILMIRRVLMHAIIIHVIILLIKR